MRCITLTTDFGLADWFVGTMKGVILSRAPGARVIDLTHGVPAGDIAAGAFALAAGCRWFPRGTVHVAVVDPGVGGPRAPIAVRTADYFFVGPDNGVLSLAMRREKIRAIHRLENEGFLLPDVSRTFHGRDVFAPVAAALARGVAIGKLGPRVRSFVRLPWPEPERDGHAIRGEVVHVDVFGNAITNIAADTLTDASDGRAAWLVRAGRHRIRGLSECYEAVPRGKTVALIGSTGLLEVSVNGGSAAERLGLRKGTAVTVEPALRAARSRRINRRVV